MVRSLTIALFGWPMASSPAARVATLAAPSRSSTWRIAYSSSIEEPHDLHRLSLREVCQRPNGSVGTIGRLLTHVSKVDHLVFELAEVGRLFEVVTDHLSGMVNLGL